MRNRWDDACQMKKWMSFIRFLLSLQTHQLNRKQDILKRFAQNTTPLSNQMEHGHVRNAEDGWFLGWPDRVLEPEKHFGAVRIIQSAISSIMNSLLTHRKTGASFFAQFWEKCAGNLSQNHR